MTHLVCASDLDLLWDSQLKSLSAVGGDGGVVDGGVGDRLAVGATASAMKSSTRVHSTGATGAGFGGAGAATSSPRVLSAAALAAAVLSAQPWPPQPFQPQPFESQLRPRVSRETKADVSIDPGQARRCNPELFAQALQHLSVRSSTVTPTADKTMPALSKLCHCFDRTGPQRLCVASLPDECVARLGRAE
jgi:hypothetical protein